MPLHFSSPNCLDLIEIRASPGTSAVGCIRIKAGQCQLFAVKGESVERVGLFGTLEEAKMSAEGAWGAGQSKQLGLRGSSHTKT